MSAPFLCIFSPLLLSPFYNFILKLMYKGEKNCQELISIVKQEVLQFLLKKLICSKLVFRRVLRNLLLIFFLFLIWVAMSIMLNIFSISIFDYPRKNQLINV